MTPGPDSSYWDPPSRAEYEADRKEFRDDLGRLEKVVADLAKVTVSHHEEFVKSQAESLLLRRITWGALGVGGTLLASLIGAIAYRGL